MTAPMIPPKPADRAPRPPVPAIGSDDALWPDLRQLAEAAVGAGPAAGVARLRRAGLLALDFGDGRGLGAQETLALATLLRRLGRADLVMARLFEGHVNALKLIALHGTDSQRRTALAEARDGLLFGVWGADASPPAVLAGGQLAGVKRFCSGLGVVARAVVPVAGQLVLIDATDPARQDAEAWTAAAMRASASGRFTLDGIAHQALGPPEVYTTEPFFEGGIWRYACAHVGGAEALVALAQATLARQGRDAGALQSARLATAVARLHAARLMVEGAAVAVEAAGRADTAMPARGSCDGPGTDAGDPSGADSGDAPGTDANDAPCTASGTAPDPAAGDAPCGANPATPDAIPRAVALALLAREVVEASCVEVMTLTERALGTIAHDTATPIDRIRRDLSLFLRQANPDGKLAQAAALIREGGWPTGETW